MEVLAVFAVLIALACAGSHSLYPLKFVLWLVLVCVTLGVLDAPVPTRG